MISFIVFALSGLFIVYFSFFHQFRKERLLSKIPGPPSLPLFGNALELNVSNEFLFAIMRFSTEKFKGFNRSKIFNKVYITVGRVDVAQKILSSNVHIEKSTDYDLLKPWLGTGLLTSQGQKWFHRRKMLTPTFHFKILEDFMDVFNEQTNTLVQVLRNEFGDGKPFNIFPFITRCALDIICESAMGKSINAQKERDSEYVRAVYRIGELIQYRMTRPWLHPNIIWRLSPSGKEERKLLHVLHIFTEQVIAERREQILRHKRIKSDTKPLASEDEVFMTAKRRIAFLDMLITAQIEQREADPGNALTDLDIREETDTFMFEGHDTTAANANWTTFLLGSYPEYQVKVYEELQEIFGDDMDRPMTSDDLTKMKYLECCIKESLRLYPSVPFVARAINSDLDLENGTVIPGGTTAFILPYMIHRDAAVFPEPEVFFPDRFFPENSAGRNPFSYVPFSAGPRNCIGQKFAMMEEKVLLANLLRNFKVEAAERREDIILLAQLIMRPKNGLRVKLVPRR